MRVFISYSSADRDFVLRLANDLVKAGYEAWLDVWKISGRMPYWDEIQAGIEGCSHFLFLISPDSLAESSGARDELYHAAGLKPRPIFIPAMVQEYPYDKLPIVISAGRYQIQDFTRQSYDVVLSNILNALGVEKPISYNLQTVD